MHAGNLRSWSAKRRELNAALGRLAATVTATDWWRSVAESGRSHRPDRPTILAVDPAALVDDLTIRLAPRGTRGARGGWYETSGYTASLPPNSFGLNGLVLAHEVAHAAHYLWAGVPWTFDLPDGDGGHGPRYAGIFVETTRLLLGSGPARELAARFDTFSVDVEPFEHTAPGDEPLVARWLLGEDTETLWRPAQCFAAVDPAGVVKPAPSLARSPSATSWPCSEEE